ncbi:hypothetical protein GCM10010515_62180 [Streptomyces fructofermentans]|uniref:Uncharacterized protein n=1 Tax=Streptomyces fructofermentans TaxID=152141 RepID=A0A918NQ65_9ACTN|nr:hypothetical protein GCM10010515_62180 [Streptomyces fructofermentans]
MTGGPRDAGGARVGRPRPGTAPRGTGRHPGLRRPGCRRTLTVERPGGATGAVRTQDANGPLTVVPDEALPHPRAGTLDHRLFDVGGLIRRGSPTLRPADCR